MCIHVLQFVNWFHGKVKNNVMHPHKFYIVSMERLCLKYEGTCTHSLEHVLC
jgi:hypothetical protein